MYGLIFEPIDPEVESTRLKYRRAIARVFETIIREGIAAGEFRDLYVEVAATCLVGAFMEGLIEGGMKLAEEDIHRRSQFVFRRAIAASPPG